MERTRIPPVSRPKVELDEIGGRNAVDLVVAAVRGSNARCLLPGTDRELTFRSGELWDVVPGECITVPPRRVWRFWRHTYLTGTIESTRLDVSTLGLRPLELRDMGMWDPLPYEWDDVDGKPETWAKPILERGPRPGFEMEQVVPGEDPEDPDSDPILEAVDLRQSGDASEARDLLMDLVESDLRCLDAHAHLGSFDFKSMARKALRHYEVGVRIGELSLGADFDGVLEWAAIDNRPYLRCLHGYGLCLWRLENFEEAERIFERLLWLNPTDNQGVRFVLEEVRARRTWSE